MYYDMPHKPSCQKSGPDYTHHRRWDYNGSIEAALREALLQRTQ